MKILINQKLNFCLDDFDQKSFEETIARAEEYEKKFLVFYKLEGRTLTILEQKIRLDEEYCCEVITWLQRLGIQTGFDFQEFEYYMDGHQIKLSIR